MLTVTVLPGKAAAAKRGALASQLERWWKLCDGLEDPDVELTVEEFAPVLATFRALERCGLQFDRMLAALMGVLERQIFNTHEDPDCDVDHNEDVDHSADRDDAGDVDHTAGGNTPRRARYQVKTFSPATEIAKLHQFLARSANLSAEELRKHFGDQLAVQLVNVNRRGLAVDRMGGGR